MKLGASTAMKTRQDSRKLGGFGKRWNSGDTLSVFYPIFKDDNGQWDILVAQVWGHSIDPKVMSLKRIFIPSNSEVVDGDPTTADALFQFSRLSPLFIKGEYNEKLQKIRHKAGKLTDSMLKQAEQELDSEYQLKDGRIGKSPAVSRLRLVVSTEVVAVKHGEGGRPILDQVALVTQDLSDSRIRKLKQVLNNPDIRLEDDSKYLEVTYTFGTSSIRQQDAQVDPIATLPEYRISERFPQEWLTVQGFIESLPESTDTIKKRNSSYKPLEESRIISAIQSYSVMNSELLDMLTEEEDVDRLKYNARLLRSLSVSLENEEVNEAINEDIKAEAEEKALQQLVDEANAVPEETQEEVPFEQEKAPTLANIISKEELEAARTDDTADVEDIGEGSDISNELV